MPFTSKQLITTDKDLEKYMKKIPKTWEFTNKGTFIIPYDNLLTLKHDFFLKKKKIAIVLNSIHSQEIQTTGHWILLALDLRSNDRKCLLVDSLANVYKKKKDLKNVIDTFCDTHHLSLTFFNLKCQNSQSLSCGFFLIFFLFFLLYITSHILRN